MKKTFVVTEDHIKLLKRAQVSWIDEEFGAPGIDPKKPYGNSDVTMDIAEILGFSLFEDQNGEKHLSYEQCNLCRQLHAEIETVLQILLFNCAIQSGEYEREQYSSQWRRL